MVQINNLLGLLLSAKKKARRWFMSSPIQRSVQCSFCPREKTEIKAKVSIYQRYLLLSTMTYKGEEKNIDLFEKTISSYAKDFEGAVKLMKATLVRQKPVGRFRVAVETQELEGTVEGVLLALKGIFPAQKEKGLGVIA